MASCNHPMRVTKRETSYPTRNVGIEANETGEGRGPAMVEKEVTK